MPSRVFPGFYECAFDKADHPLKKPWQRVKAKSLVDGVCKACASKMSPLSAAETIRLQPLDDMLGHPGMAGYRDQGHFLRPGCADEQSQVENEDRPVAGRRRRC